METRFVRAYIDSQQSVGLEFECTDKGVEDKIRLVNEEDQDWLYGIDGYVVPLDRGQFSEMANLVKQDYPYIECVLRECC